MFRGGVYLPSLLVFFLRVRFSLEKGLTGRNIVYAFLFSYFSRRVGLRIRPKIPIVQKSGLCVSVIDCPESNSLLHIMSKYRVADIDVICRNRAFYNRFSDVIFYLVPVPTALIVSMLLH